MIYRNGQCGHDALADIVRLGQSYTMRRWNSFSLAIALIGQSGVAWAQTGNFSPPPTPQLMGLSPSDAASLLSKLGDAQRRMRLGDFQSFELLAGSIASYPETRITPRDAFLQVAFDKVWRV